MKRQTKKSKEIKEKLYEEEWQDMPEFIQEDRESIKGVVVHFETLEDMELFSKLIGRKITMKTKGIFFPIKEKGDVKVYVDES